MTHTQIKLLKLLNFISVAVAIGLWVLCLVSLPDHEWLRMRMDNLPFQLSVLSHLLIISFSIIISIKRGSQKGTLLFAFFLSLFSQNFALISLSTYHNSLTLLISAIITNALASVFFLKTFQNFPRQLTNQDIDAVFAKKKIVRKFIKWTLKDYTGVLFFLVILAGVTAGVFTGVFIPVNFIVLIIGFLYLFINYRRSPDSGKNKIAWLFWGLLASIFIELIMQVLIYFNGQEMVGMKAILALAQTFVLVLALIMSLFFYDTFDTGAIITRTIADSSIFILIVIAYNTSEHYFLHWLSHTLELSDVMVSSLLSGIFVMLFSPVHHRLMGFLGRKFKRQAVEHV